MWQAQQRAGHRAGQRAGQAMCGGVAVMALGVWSIAALPPKPGENLGVTNSGQTTEPAQPGDVAEGGMSQASSAQGGRADEATAREVRGTLAQLANAAVAGKTEDVVAVLDRAARSRLGKAEPAHHGAATQPMALAEAARQFETRFRAKYGTAFEARPEMLEGLAVMKTAMPTRVTVVALATAVPANTEPAAGPNAASAAQPDATGVRVPTRATAAGSAAAQARAAERVGATGTGLGATLVKEGEGVEAWRITVGRELTRQELERQLTMRLEALSGPEAPWPATAQEMVVQMTGELLGALSPAAMAEE